MQFSKFSKILQELESTSSRNEMTEVLVQLLKAFRKSEVAEAMYLMQGRVVPRFIDLEFNVARKLMMQAIAKAFRKEVKEINSLFGKFGDLGIVCENLNKRKRSKHSIMDVYKKLYKIALLEGTGSQEGKVSKTAELLKSSDSQSSKYIVRMVIGNLRLGLSDKTVLDALSFILTRDKSAREILDKAYGARSDIGFLAEEVIGKGMKVLKKISITPGIPIASMNCERENTIEKILKRLDKALIQPKYDGLRTQVHFSKTGFKTLDIVSLKQESMFEKEAENIRIYSRNLEDLTHMFPDAKKAMLNLGVDSIIFDSEAVGYNPKTKRYTPFQETIQRRRKYDVVNAAKSTPIKLFVFDILYLNGKDHTDLSLTKRLDILKRILKKSNQNVVEFAPSSVVDDVKGFKKLSKKYIKGGLEGVIAKSQDGKYYPGKRGFEWIKFKKSAAGHLIDEIDTVVLGYYRGRGARAKFGIGAMLVGVLNTRSKKFESIAKVGTGIKDDEWEDIKSTLDKLQTKKSPRNVKVDKGLVPDVWVNPKVVIVVDADEITLSPSHRAGFLKGKGYSLRFPRLKEFNRRDKEVDDITTVTEIRKMYKLQYGK
ncbi:ATP-dependent DNA ligase [Patescibacteria group bacterium]